MKKVRKTLIILIILGLVILISLFIIKKMSPIDDTKKLYISCENTQETYDVLSGNNINFASNNKNCNLNIEIRNVDRNFIKLKTNNYFYDTCDFEKYDCLPSNSIYVSSDVKTVIYSYDKKQKFEFIYK